MSRTRPVLALAFALTLSAALPPAAAGPVKTPPSVVVNTVTSNPDLYADRCRVTTSVTADGFKGKAPSLWLLRAGVSPVNLGPAVKGVATTYSIGTLPNDEATHLLRFELRDNRGKVLAADEDSPQISCLPGLQILSVTSVPYPGRPDLCALPLTWQVNMLPDGWTTAAVMRRISDNSGAWATTGFVTTEDIGVPRTEALLAGGGGAIGREVDSGWYELWIEFDGGDIWSPIGRSNTVSVQASCPVT